MALYQKQIKSNDRHQIDLPRGDIDAYVSTFDSCTWFEVIVRKYRPKTSNPLRKYYFGFVLPPWMKEIGYDPDELKLVHEQLKIRYFNSEPDKRGIYRDVPSVFSDESELDVSEKYDFVEWAIRKAAIDGVVIKNPRRPRGKAE